jgi:K+-transporting ATPase ATPase C chain
VKEQLKASLIMLAAFTLLTGIAYPLAITGLAGLAFPGRAGGSLIRRGDVVIGSALVGQPFEGPGRFWSRPSATGPMPYNAASSTGSNLGPMNSDLLAAVEERIARVRAGHPGQGPVPIDLVTASSSGLDPHITPAGALYQVARVARERALPETEVRALVERRIEGRQLGMLGEPRVNVLLLNLALDSLAAARAPAPPP